MSEMCIFIRKSPSESSSGVEGILNRLEKERNIAFGIGLRDKGGEGQITMDDIQHGNHLGMPVDEVSAPVVVSLN